MALNFLAAHSFGGGPAHLLSNPAPGWCALLCGCNGATVFASVGAIIYASFASAPFSGEVLQYLVFVSALGVWGAAFWWRLARSKQASDEEWSRWVLVSLLANVLQYGVVAWGAWLCHRMTHARLLPGTRMHYTTFAARWLYNAILSVSSLGATSVALGSYVSLVALLLNLLIQRAQKKIAL